MGTELLNPDASWQIGQKIQIIDGPFSGFEGVIYLIDWKERMVRVKIDFFTRLTPVELPFSYLKTLNGDK
jgi:transcriptional antiterminator NusG